MPALADVPLEVLIDNILPYLPLSSIARLAQASKSLAALCADDTFWKRKLQEDYNFSDASTARTAGGYQFLYRGFHRAKLYVWGYVVAILGAAVCVNDARSAGEGRLGFPLKRSSNGILHGSRPYPVRLDISAARIVDLAAGGWSFHALDAEGCLHVWGQLNGEGLALNVDSFAIPTKRVSSPLKLAIPEKLIQISCGRSHSAALSAGRRVWVFTTWGMPYVIPTSMFPSPPCQVECGWGFVSVLTQAGDVCVWWPWDGEFGDRLREHSHGGEAGGPKEEGGVIQCWPWELDASPEQLLDFAGELPLLHGEDSPVGTKIVKIAAGDDFLIALTEGGHVLRVDFVDGHESLGRIPRPRWEYLPQFSDVNQIQEHPAFVSQRVVAPQKMHITHVSANFNTFFAYSTGSSSIVLQGKKENPAGPVQPIIMPELQNRGVISVVLGDYHFGALTSSGKLLTWGEYSSGALGLGDPTVLPVGAPGGYVTEEQRENATRMRTIPSSVNEPTEVKFGTRRGGEGRKVFVFMTAAAGWHTGALVLDLEDGDDKVEDESEQSEPVTHGGPSRLFRFGLPLQLMGQSGS